MKTIWPDGLKGAELFRFLKANKTAILDMKKSVHKTADVITLMPGVPALPSHLMRHKSYLYSNNEEKGVLERTIVMNTYNWLDSHDDVHQNNLFAKSLNDRGERIPHLHDHIFELAARVGEPIKWSEQEISWRELGVQKDGNTMALILESKILKSLNKNVYRDYLNNKVDQHSVKMSYIKMALAINDSDYKEEYKEWQDTIDTVGNKKEAEDQGYYFPIYEGRLYEGSAVLLGSNELTPTLGNKFESGQPTQAQSRIALDVEELVKCYKL